jgi:hypothetical protein
MLNDKIKNKILNTKITKAKKKKKEYQIWKEKKNEGVKLKKRKIQKLS